MKNQSYEIKPCENGYIIEHSWYVKNGEFTDYKNKKYIYPTWAEVSDWVKNNELEIPPQ